MLTSTPHPLTKFEIQAYYQNEPRFNGVFSRDNLPNTICSHELGSAVKNGAYVLILMNIVILELIGWHCM